MTRETVINETPAWRATSDIVTLLDIDERIPTVSVTVSANIIVAFIDFMVNTRDQADHGFNKKMSDNLFSGALAPEIRKIRIGTVKALHQTKSFTAKIA